MGEEGLGKLPQDDVRIGNIKVRDKFVDKVKENAVE